ncbi:hypothetical protein PVMG_03644 [Plasmodium vivax Mauritania I]|uniref:Pv-fam-c protein n=1 Tax=Plasmodium vivax Mauritania I TaxID=1035515 RepID=A0A0J9TB27_PLAVI|nr:hypothetical protein PVMG_03644 [Plasmodium vivax Mauritania I]
MSIIHGVKFGMILDHIQKRNISGIKSWINGYENKLTEYLNKKHKPSKNKDLVKYCTNLNHILDYVVQGINNLKMYDCVYWIHQVDEGSKKALRQYPSLNCERDLHNYKNKYLFFKKLMLDLCEDIEYIKKNQHFLKNKKKCPKIMSRLQYREKTLMQLFDTFYNKSMFYQDSQCSINFIHRNLSNISCDNVGEKPNITGASEGSTVTASPSSERAEQHADEKLRKTEHEGVLETKDSQDPDHGDGLDDPGPVDPIPEGLKFSLPVNEDPPKLDTTYAAASLAGISLFGTILYKVKYYYINEILYKSFIFYILC